MELSIQDFKYDEGENLLTLVDDLPMLIPQQETDSTHISLGKHFERETNYRLYRIVYVRNALTRNTVPFTYQSMEGTITRITNPWPDRIKCHYVVQPGSLWNSKLHNDKGQPLKLILTHKIQQAQ